MKIADFCRRAELAIRLGAIAYAATLTRQVVRRFPGHVQARCLLGQVHLEEANLREAREHFEAVLTYDPENVVALSGMGVILGSLGELEKAIKAFESAYELQPNRTEVADGLLQLYSQRGDYPAELSPVPRAAVARWHARRGDRRAAVAELSHLLALNPEDRCLQLARAEALWRAERLQDAERVCHQILQSLPQCAKAQLILAEIWIRDIRRESQGVGLIHEVLSADPSATVARRLFRDGELELPVLADEIELDASACMPAPPEVETALRVLGDVPSEDEEEWTPASEPALSIPTGSEIASIQIDPDVAAMQAEIDRLASPRPRRRSRGQKSRQLLRTEIIISSKTRLIDRYGPSGFRRIDAGLSELRSELADSGVGAHVIYVDDASRLARYRLRPVSPDQPSEIKTLVDRLERELGGEMLQGGSTGLHIVGGDSIIPFFRLPNPADDDDPSIPSDNPYASRDWDFLVPDRAVGRLPDGEDPSPALLLAQIDALASNRQNVAYKTGGLLDGLRWPFGLGKDDRLTGFGYASLIWQTAAESVFGLVDSPDNLWLSPPLTAESFDPDWLSTGRIHYYNLHGALDAPHWYGQKDGRYTDDYPMLPVALTPDMVMRADLAGSLIYTEACYGANILDKPRSESMALSFLGAGAAAVIGSTAISYGVVEPPLSGADLLGIYLLRYILDGLPLGEALVQAKLSFGEETLNRQGWLDGDDQKTILGFTLYGDPGLQLAPSRTDVAPVDLVGEKPVSVPLLCKRRTVIAPTHRPETDLVQNVIQHLQVCCPDLSDGKMKVTRRRQCNGHCGDVCHCHPSSSSRLLRRDQIVTRTRREPAPVTSVTCHKSIHTDDGRDLPSIARVTVDARGGIIKTVVSH